MVMQGDVLLINLLSLKKRETALISQIIDNPAFGEIDGLVARRLRDLGFLPGTSIKIIAKSLFADAPISVQIGSGAQFSLRREEAQKICCCIS